MNRDFPLLAEKVIHSLEHFGTCEFCNNVYPDTSLRKLPDSIGNKIICDGCYDDNFFDCHKCKRVLPHSEIGEDDNDAGYGYFCKDCIKPMGFPQEVVIAPDFPGCEEVAGGTLDALCKYAYQATGSMEPEYSDTITLKFVKKLSEDDALYESQKGAKYEIGELDYLGIGAVHRVRIF